MANLYWVYFFRSDNKLSGIPTTESAKQVQFNSYPDCESQELVTTMSVMASNSATRCQMICRSLRATRLGKVKGGDRRQGQRKSVKRHREKRRLRLVVTFIAL